MPRHFSKVYHSPYFQSEHYKHTKSYAFEKKVERRIAKIRDFFNPFRLFKKGK